jgi:glutamyl-tRNA reductase
MDITKPTLDSLIACGWTTLGLPRREVLAVERDVAGRHGGGAVLVSCQRVEAYSLGHGNACEAAVRWRGGEAVAHLAEVAAGLHSVVLGERQILGQTRAAFREADAGLRPWGDVAIASARELRERHRFTSHAGHLLDRALKMSSVPATGTLMVLGTGEMGQLVARRGRELGFARVYIAGRAAPARADASWEFLRLDRLQLAPAVDVIAGCLGSAAGTVDADELPAVRRLIADLGTPPNFAGAFEVPVLTIADLLAGEQAMEPVRRRREALMAEVQEIVERRLVRVASDAEGRVAAFRARAEATRAREVERMLRLHPQMDHRAIEAFSRSLVNQLLHGPSQKLRESDGETAEAFLEFFQNERRKPNGER